MEALSYGAGSESGRPVAFIVQGSSGKYSMVFNGCRVSREQMATVCALIQEGKRISAIEY